MNLDIKDIKIITLLSKDSRKNHSNIGKSVGLSGESVKSRIEKLEHLGIIKAYKVNMNYALMGFLEYDVYLKLKNYNEKELNDIIKYLCKNKYVTWVGTCFGSFDLRVSLVVKKTIEINDFIDYIQKKYSNYLIDYQILFLVEKYKVPQNRVLSSLLNTDVSKLKLISNEKVPLNIIKTKSKITIDKTEKAILSILNKDPQISLVKISQELNLTPENIKYRINSLKKKEIIKSFGAIIDGNKLNKIWAVFLFKISGSVHKDFLKFISEHSNISAFLNMMGNWNYSVTVFANNVQEIHNILMDFRNKFPNSIQNYDLILLFETFKYPAVPDVIFE